MITDQVKKFISNHIHSIVELDVLLLLYNHSEKDWSAEDVNQELRLSSIGAAQLLVQLCSQGLISRSGVDPILYKYNPKNNDLDSTVRDLFKVYETHKQTIISFIYSKPSSNVQLFADAFKLKKDGDKKEEN